MLYYYALHYYSFYVSDKKVVHLSIEAATLNNKKKVYGIHNVGLCVGGKIGDISSHILHFFEWNKYIYFLFLFTTYSNLMPS